MFGRRETNRCSMESHAGHMATTHGHVGRAARTTRQMKRKSKRIIQHRKLALIALAGAILFFGYDLAVDALFEGEFGSPHFIIELIVFAGVSLALVVGARDLRLLRARLDREAKHNRAISGELAKSLSEQMDEWRMTRSEQEVAWMIIKGYRFAEIAQSRGVKESTCRSAGYIAVREGRRQRTRRVRRRDLPATAADDSGHLSAPKRETAHPDRVELTSLPGSGGGTWFRVRRNGAAKRDGWMETCPLTELPARVGARPDRADRSLHHR